MIHLSSGMTKARDSQASLRLILLPGLDGTGLLFEPLLRQLPTEIKTTVIRYPSDQRQSYDELLVFLRDQLPRDACYLLLAESFSGPLAIRLAAESPTGLQGLVLVGTFLRKPVRWVPRWMSRFLPAILFRLMPVWGHFRMLTSGKSTSELRRLYQTAFRQVKPGVLACRAAEILRVDVSEEFQRISVPTLVLAGKYDHIVPAQNLRQFQRLRSDLQVEMIDSGHLLLQGEPWRAAEVIQRFAVSVSET